MTITKELLEKFNEKFKADPSNAVAASAIARVGINEASVNNEVIRHHSFLFSEKTKMGEITNQKKSGRCWMFSALNTARVETMRKLNMKTLEFSQNYTLFWDKLEKSNFFLDSIIDTCNEPLNSRVVAHLLTAPVQDGGQWDMFKGLLKKYGVVPKYIMPETFHSSDTAVMENILTKRLRRDALVLRTAYENGESKEKLEVRKEDMLYEIYNILVKCLGEPPVKFDFEYEDKDENFHKMEDLTPQSFFEKVVGWKLEDKVSLINAPTKDKPYEKVYTVKYLGTVAEADPIKYLNLPIEELKKAAIKSIQNGDPVWFGCDVGQMYNRDLGLMDMELYNYDKTLTEMGDFDKAARLDYGESLLTHAMVFTGVDLDKDGNPINWKVENSWGDDVGKKGIYSMSDKWFEEYNYQIMVDKKYLPEKYAEMFKEEAIELEPWDPFGALAFLK